MRTPLKPPSGFEGYLSRRQAAVALGLPSEYKVRQLEKEGRLRPVRGRMGSAWYRRDDVLALRSHLAASSAGSREWSDADLLTLLRQRSLSLLDLVVDTGISIARAERVHRFWTAHAAPALPERRSSDRLERATLIQQLRDPDPRVRAAVFERLRSLPDG